MKPELGALKLTAEEVASFEKWVMDAQPTELIVEAAKMHRELRLRAAADLPPQAVVSHGLVSCWSPRKLEKAQ
jgi:hypothetical protein